VAYQRCGLLLSVHGGCGTLVQRGSFKLRQHRKIAADIKLGH
jgi:hypothetical protein